MKLFASALGVCLLWPTPWFVWASQPNVARIGASIQIVWPHDGKGANVPAEQALAVNITTVLGNPPGMPAGLVPCAFDATVWLWAAVNNTPARQVARGIKRIARADVPSRFPPLRMIPSTYPVWDFNDVNVSPAQASGNKVHFFVTVEGPVQFAGTTWESIHTYSSVWTHGADARTYQPQAPVPKGLSMPEKEVDTVIRIVWPHGDGGNPQTVETGELVNISAMVLVKGTEQSVPPDWDGQVSLHRSFNNTMEFQGSDPGEKRIVSEGGMIFPVWDFNDIRVPRSADLPNTQYFWVRVEGMNTYPAIWAHGTDPRTIFPEQELPREPVNCP